MNWADAWDYAALTYRYYLVRAERWNAPASYYVMCERRMARARARAETARRERA